MSVKWNSVLPGEDYGRMNGEKFDVELAEDVVSTVRHGTWQKDERVVGLLGGDAWSQGPRDNVRMGEEREWKCERCTNNRKWRQWCEVVCKIEGTHDRQM